MENIYEINGMKCQGCVDNISKILDQLAGVDSYIINLDDKTIKILGSLSKDELEDALSETVYSLK